MPSFSLVYGDPVPHLADSPRSGEVVGAKRLELEDLKWHTELWTGARGNKDVMLPFGALKPCLV